MLFHPFLSCVFPGKAASNVFDGDKHMDGTVLHGIASPSQLGLLTLFEWYKYVEVRGKSDRAAGSELRVGARVRRGRALCFPAYLLRSPPLWLLTLFFPFAFPPLAGQVGANLKDPQLPIWVVCSESHFTVLFSNDKKSLMGSRPFDLLFYDELANMEVGVHCVCVRERERERERGRERKREKVRWPSSS